jgi:transmembrane sensor
VKNSCAATESNEVTLMPGETALNFRSGASPDEPAITAAAAEWFARRDAGLSIAQEQAFQRWLAADPRHRAALARLDSAWSTFGKPTRVDAADELLLELGARKQRRRRRRLSAAAATVAVLLALGALWRIPGHDEAAREIPATAMMIVPERKVLPDGSVILLKDGAQIAEGFTATVRRVELQQGEAMFEVASELSRPFVVSAGGVEVRAVGTAFSVQLAGSTVEVLVTKGKVAVGSGDEAESTADISNDSAAPSSVGRPPSASTIEAGHRIVVETVPSRPAPKVTPVAATELDQRLAWRNRRVEFSGTPMAEAVALLNREAAGRSEVKLVIDDPALRSMRVSGIFRTDNMDAFILLLEAGFGVSAERLESTIRLRKSPAAPESY